MPFQEYVFSFYGPGEVYGDYFKQSLSWEEISLATRLRLSSDSLPFEGDSLDREIVRDIMLRIRGVTSVEHCVDPYLREFFLVSA